MAPGDSEVTAPLLPGAAGGSGAGKAASGDGRAVQRSVHWTFLAFLILAEIAGQGVFALPLHLSRLGWLAAGPHHDDAASDYQPSHHCVVLEPTQVITHSSLALTP